jgi:hypothetical protein
VPTGGVLYVDNPLKAHLGWVVGITRAEQDQGCKVGF